MLEEDPNRYYRCFHCGYIFRAQTLELLCVLVNQHNDEYHHGISMTHWTPASIVFSSSYSGADAPTQEERVQAAHPYAKPEYTKRWGTTNHNSELWGNAEKSPVLTEGDKEWLRENKVKW